MKNRINKQAQANMQIIKNNDGHWLRFENSQGGVVRINVENIFKKHPVTKKLMLQWLKDALSTKGE